MPKRQCPFDFDLTPQMKMHIGQKEMDEKNAHKMSLVHDKTMQKLFDGAKHCNYGTMDCNDNNNNVSEYCAMCVDLNLIERKCTYCDVWVCRSCSAECVKCKRIYCVKHSLRLYRCELYERMCLNCCIED